MAREPPSLSDSDLRVIVKAYLGKALSSVRQDIISRPLPRLPANGPSASDLLAAEMHRAESRYKTAIDRKLIYQGHALASEIIATDGLGIDQASPQFQELSFLALRLLREQARYGAFLYRGREDAWTPSDQLFLEATVESKASPNATDAVAPSEPAEPDESQPTLGQVIDEFLATQQRAIKPRSYEKHAHQLKIAAAFFGQDTRIVAIRPKRVLAYVQRLQELPANFTKHFHGISLAEVPSADAAKLPKMKVGAINPYLSSLSSLFSFAKKLEYVDSNPAAKMALRDSEKAKDKRNPFSLEQLAQVFNSPLYRGFKRAHPLKPGNTILRDARYWLPIIALWTGMRRDEIMRLTAGDIRQERSVWHFDIRDAKTNSGIRKVPIHPFLIDIGLLQFTDRPAEQPLFTGYTGDAIGKFFTRFLRSIGLDGKKLCFHSFRHTFADAAREAGIEITVLKQLMGHSDGDVTSGYGSGHTLEALGRALSTIAYKGLDLGHLQRHEEKSRKRSPEAEARTVATA